MAGSVLVSCSRRKRLVLLLVKFHSCKEKTTVQRIAQKIDNFGLIFYTCPDQEMDLAVPFGIGRKLYVKYLKRNGLIGEEDVAEEKNAARLEQAAYPSCSVH
uniref:Uncharacterized protein n=1 Tax=Oryza punctata TaxID=4537 RepID=A0A0E0LAF4_ORYPU